MEPPGGRNYDLKGIHGINEHVMSSHRGSTQIINSTCHIVSNVKVHIGKNGPCQIDLLCVDVSKFVFCYPM